MSSPESLQVQQGAPVDILRLDAHSVRFALGEKTMRVYWDRPPRAPSWPLPAVFSLHEQCAQRIAHTNPLYQEALAVCIELLVKERA